MNTFFTFLLIYFLSLSTLFAQKENRLPWSKRNSAFSLQVTGGYGSGGPYISGFGRLGLMYEKHIFSMVGLNIGISHLANGINYGTGIPISAQLNPLNKRRRGPIICLGIMPQFGVNRFEPRILPTFEMKCRIGFGKSRWFFEPHLFIFKAYGYHCANGTFTCPGNLTLNERTSPAFGLGLGIGRYNQKLAAVD
jgi:hypothetical protein